jgi:predicted protein tyrosine phosphatase
MKLLIVPRLVIERMIENPNYLTYNRYGDWGLISISTTEQEKVIGLDKLKQYGCVNYSQFVFHDLTEPYKDCILFNEEIAKQIIDFVNNIKLNLIIIHCDAGISRSGAVGYFICNYLNLDQKEFKIMNPNIHPNSLVLDILKKVSGYNEDLQNRYDELFRINETNNLKINFT